MRHITINRSKLRRNWKNNPSLQLEKVYWTPFEQIYEGPDVQISIGLLYAYLFIFSDNDYDYVCENLLRH